MKGTEDAQDARRREQLSLALPLGSLTVQQPSQSH